MSADSDAGREASAAHSRERAVAEAVWGSAVRDVAPTDDVGAVVDRLLTVIEAGLRRWIGAEGYAVLLARAASETLPTRPALAGLADVVTAPPVGVAATGYTDAETRQAVLTLLVTMMRLLGDIIGEDMAIRLVELSGTPSTRGIAGAETNDLPS